MTMERKDSSNVCAECGGRMGHRAYKHVEKVGRYKVNDATAFAWQCEDEKCGEVELTLERLAGYQRRAAATVLREAPEIDGAIVKESARSKRTFEVQPPRRACG